MYKDIHNASYEEAENTCLQKGMRLPTVEEARTMYLFRKGIDFPDMIWCSGSNGKYPVFSFLNGNYYLEDRTRVFPFLPVKE